MPGDHRARHAKLSAPSAAYLQEKLPGRAHRGPVNGGPPDAPFTFVTDGVEKAVARACDLAAEKAVGVASPDIVGQCLDLELLDEIVVDLVPVLFGRGVRFFDHPATFPVVLDGPTVVEATGSPT